MTSFFLFTFHPPKEQQDKNIFFLLLGVQKCVQNGGKNGPAEIFGDFCMFDQTAMKGNLKVIFTFSKNGKDLTPPPKKILPKQDPVSFHQNPKMKTLLKTKTKTKPLGFWQAQNNTPLI